MLHLAADTGCDELLALSEAVNDCQQCIDV